MYIPYPAIYFLINYYAISQNFVYSLTILAGSLVMVCGIMIFHSTLLQVCVTVGITGYLIFAALIFDMMIFRKKKQLSTF